MQVGHICWGSRGSIEVMPHWGGAEHGTVTWGQTGWSSWEGRSIKLSIVISGMYRFIILLGFCC